MTMSRVDELRPHEQANGEEREVLDVVDSLVPEGVVIGGGNVPGADHERPDCEAYRRTQLQPAALEDGPEDGWDRAAARPLRLAPHLRHLRAPWRRARVRALAAHGHEHRDDSVDRLLTMRCLRQLVATDGNGFWLVLAASAPIRFATDCHGLQPTGLHRGFILCWPIWLRPLRQSAPVCAPRQRGHAGRFSLFVEPLDQSVTITLIAWRLFIARSRIPRLRDGSDYRGNRSNGRTRARAPSA